MIETLSFRFHFHLRYIELSFDGKFLSFSLAQGPPRDLQIIAYKYDSTHV